MSAWTKQELGVIADSEELHLASRRSDGSLRPETTMWVVRVGDNVYVRSAGGAGQPWFRHAMSSKFGHVRAGRVDADAQFATTIPDSNDEIDAQYHAKYDRYGPNLVGHVTGKAAHAVTVHLIKRAERGASDE